MNHTIGVAAVIHDGQGNILFQHRKKEPGAGRYVLPGGKLDEADPLTGIARELKEELNLEVLHTLALSREIFFAHDVLGDGTPMIMLYYLLRIDRETQIVENMEPEKCYGLHWISYSKIPRAQMWANDLLAIWTANRIGYFDHDEIYHD